MSAPQPPYGPQPGYPQQPQGYPPSGQQPQGYPPPQGQPPQSQPQGYPQQQPGYPPQQYAQQQPYGGYQPQQPYGGSPQTAYIAAGGLGLGTLILAFLDFRFFQVSIPQPIQVLPDMLIWLPSIAALFAVLTAGAAAALFYTRSYLAPRLAITAGILGVLVLVANLADRNWGGFRQTEAMIACALGMGMIVVGLLPQIRAVLKPKPQQTPHYPYPR